MGGCARSRDAVRSPCFVIFSMSGATCTSFPRGMLVLSEREREGEGEEREEGEEEEREEGEEEEREEGEGGGS